MRFSEKLNKELFVNNNETLETKKFVVYLVLAIALLGLLLWMTVGQL